MAAQVTAARSVTLAGILVLSGVLLAAKGERVKNKIYDEIQGDMPCFKRFNGTHEIGCTSKFFGNIGVLHVVSEKADFDWVYEQGPHQPYVLAFTPLFLTEAVLQRAQDSGKVSGVVVVVPEDFDPETLLLDGFSGEVNCPNRYLGLYNDSADPTYAGHCEKKPWNPNGTGLLYTNWEFPVFLITNQTSVDNIYSCFDKFNKPQNGVPRDWPLCSMELKSNMFGTTNSEVCMRRASIGPISSDNFCDPLYDFNIWGTLKPMNISEEVPDKSIIVVGARMDAATMFDNISPGANSAVSGVVSLMSAAAALYKYKEELIGLESNKNILFILFQGETWGYIGSSRVVWDMEQEQFPFKRKDDVEDQVAQINFRNIKHFIEVEQVGQAVDSSLFLHTDPISNSDADTATSTDEILEALTSSSTLLDRLTLTTVDKNTPLPPSSIQSFLKRVNVSGVVITDHKEEFKNPYYESFLDNYKNVKYNESDEADKYHKHITDVASVLATTLYKLFSGNEKKIEADPKFTNDLLYCYMKNTSCELFEEYGGEMVQKYLEEKPAKMYVSVKNGEQERSYITKYVFAGLLGDQLEKNQSDCKTKSLYDMNQFYYFSHLNNGTCVQTTVRMTEAMSPAFLIKDYNWKSGEYSTWTESGWKLTKVMIFLRPSVGEEVALVCGGVASLVLSLILVYFMNSRADLLFGLSTPPAAC